ncbi:hypothetical protein HID58_025513, partial [Brassica napus]
MKAKRMKSLTIHTLIITIFFFTISTSFASPPRLEDVFSQCTTDFKPSNPNFPIQNFTYTQQDPSFLTILNNYVRNLRYFNNTTRKPVAIVAAADVTHIQATITCAKRLSLQLRVRSGGHDYDGMSYLSTVEFVVLDMFNLRSIEFDPKLDTAWIQSDKTDNNLFIRLTLSTSNKTVKASFMGMFLGDSAKLLEIMNTDFPELGLNKSECLEIKWIESVLFWLSIPPGTAPTSVILNRIPQKQIYLKRKSDYVQKPISRTGLDAIFKVLLENENVTMAWNPYGGRMSEIPSTETAFPHRAGNMFKIQYAANWFVQGEAVANECLSQTERVFEAMSPYVSENPREAFLNYRDVDIGTSLNSTYEEGKVYGVKYFKNNFDRLVKVKSRVDPDNFFRYEQSIPVLSIATSQPVTDPVAFLRCLERQPTDPASPNSAVAYIPTNSSFTTAALGCARELSLQVRIRSGGHDFEGLSYTSTVPFFVLDMFSFRTVDVNLTDGTAWVDAGVTTGELYYRIAEKSNVLGFPAGLCTTLGVGGHFSGGGYGTMMRKYGLSVDNVVGSGIVDSNGNIFTDRVSMGEDRFWAIRGGGAASFGVVLGYKIRLVPVPEKVTVFNVGRTVAEGAVDLIMKWQSFAHSTDRNLFVRLTLTLVNGTKPGEKMVLASFIGMYLGGSDKTFNVINRDFPELKLKRTDCTEMRWIESVVFWAGFPTGTPISVLLNRTVTNKAFHKRKSDYVKRPISRIGLGLILKKLVEVENRLVDIKTLIDAENFWKNEQGIPVR